MCLSYNDICRAHFYQYKRDCSNWPINKTTTWWADLPFNIVVNIFRYTSMNLSIARRMNRPFENTLFIETCTVKTLIKPLNYPSINLFMVEKVDQPSELHFDQLISSWSHWWMLKSIVSGDYLNVLKSTIQFYHRMCVEMNQFSNSLYPSQGFRKM